MTQTAPLLDIRDLSISFTQGGKETLAVDRVSLSVDKGKTLALVGESGSGKSITALSVPRLLPGSAHHPSGVINFAGQDVLKMDERALRALRGARVTMVFQEPMTSLNPLQVIERQVGEISSFTACGRRPRGATASWRCSRKSAFPILVSGSTPIRISFPAVSASAS